MLGRALIKELFKRRNFYPVILSETKNLAPFLDEMLHFVQHDKGVVAGVFLMSNEETYFRYKSPMGLIWGTFSKCGLSALYLPSGKKRPEFKKVCTNEPRVLEVVAALERYFAGQKEDFAAIPLNLSGGTPFQQRVWRAARRTKWGHASTYGKLAAQIGAPKAARAVGQALGRNPIPIIVPCHRFLAGDGSLGGFSAGLTCKKQLLNIEGVLGD